MANKYLDAVVGPLLLVTLLLSSPVTAQEEHYEDPCTSVKLFILRCVLLIDT